MKPASLHVTTSEIVETVTITELCRHCGVSADWVIELVSEGILDPISGNQTNYRFQSTCLARVSKAEGLRRDMGINLSGIALVLDLLEERDRLLAALSPFLTEELPEDLGGDWLLADQRDVSSE
ncbi:chaperone modulator CbpM [Yoonia maritima]|uniref:chaperone modulator CbpM n=1 Tax=Yoonia maritima TaxID=1435347 RepID=UPI00373609E5